MRPTWVGRIFAGCLLGGLLVTAGRAAEQGGRWNPDIVRAAKKMTLEVVFGNYEAGLENRSRTQGVYFREIIDRPAAVEFLIARLKKDRGTPDTKARIVARAKAAYLMGKMGDRARPAVPMLIALLEDEDEVRHRVTSAFADLGPVAIAAEPALLEELHFQNTMAARALFRIDPTSEKVLEAVIERVSDASMQQSFRFQTIDAFDECKVASDRKRKFLEEVANGRTALADSAKRRLDEMAWITARRYPAMEAQPGAETNATVLLEKLKANPDDWPTAQALAKASPEARHEAASILLEALKTRRALYAGNLISRIGLFGKEAKPAMPLLIMYAEGDESGPANNALAALGEIGPDAIEAKPVAERALLDGNSLLRWRAANTLCLIDPENFNSNFERLLSELKEDSGEYRAYGIRSLGGFGARAKKAVPFLVNLLEDDSLRLNAAEALVKIENGKERVEMPSSQLLEAGTGAGNAFEEKAGATVKTKVARAITKDLRSENFYSRDTAARLLGEIGADSREVLPELREAAKSEDLEFAKIAKDAIRKIEKDEKEAK